MKGETIRRYEIDMRGVTMTKLRRLAEAMGRKLEDVLLPEDIGQAPLASRPTDVRAATRQKAIELALLLAEESGQGQSAETKARLISETLALVDSLQKALSSSGKD